MGRTRGIALALATAFLWGTIPFAGKLALGGFTPLAISAWRFVLAGLVLGVILLALGRAPFVAFKRNPGLTTLAAFGLVGNYVLYFAGLALTTPTAAQIVIQLASVFLLLWGVLLFGERLTRLRIVGASLALAGVLLVTWNGASFAELVGSGALVGNALVALSGLSWSGYAALQKRLNRGAESYGVLLGVFLVSAALTLPLAGLSGGFGAPTLVATLALGYLVLNTLAAYGAFAESLQHVEASTVAVLTTFAPIVTVVLTAALAWLAPGSVPPGSLTVWTLAGAGLVVGGVALVVRGERPVRAPRGAPPE